MTGTASAGECPELAREGLATLLGVTVSDVGDGEARTSLELRADMTNVFGKAHGGIIFALADSAFAYACNSRGGRAVAFHCSITFVEPGEVGETLVAKAREVSRKGRTGIYDVKVTSGTRTIAEFRGHSRHIEQDPSSARDGLASPDRTEDRA